MRVLFHPEFPKDVRRFEADYARISEGLARRFKNDVAMTIDGVKSSPTSAGHILRIGSASLRELRRRNLRNFPFFVLYGLTDTHLVFGSLIPSRSDPLTWLARFSGG